MVKTLQKKFIVTAMAAVSILLLVLVGALNAANCWISSRQTDRQLGTLADTEKQIMEQRESGTLHLSEPESSLEENAVRSRLFRPHTDKKTLKGSLFDPPVDEDMAMSLRFFTVFVDEKGQVVRKDISRIASVSEEEAEVYAGQAVQKEKLSGYLEHFKYQVLEADGAGQGAENYKIILFLDVSGQFRAIWMVIIISVSIAAVCWLFMLLIVVLLSRKAIRPIADNIQKQRQFVTDAGHEIKTPLAIIQANVDAMELIGGETKWSRNIRSQTVRLSGLMQNLLTLAKMDEGNLQLSMTDVSISKLLEETMQSFDEAAALKEIRMDEEIGQEIVIHANCEYIQRLFSILFDNAVKYTNPGGAVAVSLQKTDQAAVLQVKNTCEQLPQDDAERLFDRFYRGDSARTQKNGGYGIGLSAAYAIVKAHNGDISAKYMDGNTIVFIVKLPLS